MKNSMTRILIAGPIAALLALPAFAGGMNEPSAEPMIIEAAPVFVAPSFDWSGGYVGAQLGYGDVGADSVGFDGSGATYGLHAGYRYDFGQFVTGAEIDYDKTDIDLGVGTDTLDSIARLKLIAGADVGRALIYGTGGIARAKATLGGVERSDNGYFLGVGANYAVTDQVTVGAELLGHRFNNFDETGVDLKATTVTARVAYNF